MRFKKVFTEEVKFKPRKTRRISISRHRVGEIFAKTKVAGGIQGTKVVVITVGRDMASVEGKTGVWKEENAAVYFGFNSVGDVASWSHPNPCDKTKRVC